MLQVVAVDLANWVFQALRQPDLVRVHEDPLHRVATVAFNRVSSRLASCWGWLCRRSTGDNSAVLRTKLRAPVPGGHETCQTAQLCSWRPHEPLCPSCTLVAGKATRHHKRPLTAALPAHWQQAIDSP